MRSIKHTKLTELGVALIVIASCAGAYTLTHNDKKSPRLNTEITSSQNTVSPTPIDNAVTTQQPVIDPYSGWRDNTDARTGFSFKYPSQVGWTLSQADTAWPDNGRLHISSVVLDEDTNVEGVVNVFELTVAKKNSAQDFNHDHVKNSMDQNELYELVKDQTVQKGGLQGSVLEYQPRDPTLGAIKYYFFEKGQNVYNVTVNYLGEKSATTDIVGMGDKILNSIELNL